MTNLIENIKKWIEIENMLKKYNDYVKNIKDKKNNLESEIEKYFKNSNSNEIKLSNGNSIVYSQTKTAPTISIKLLNTILDETLDEKTKNIVLDKIKRKRIEESKINYSIKYKKAK